jgi:hypothetical protein
MIKKHHMIRHLHWRLVCIKRQIEKVKGTDNTQLQEKLAWELLVTEQILATVKDAT